MKYLAKFSSFFSMILEHDYADPRFKSLFLIPLGGVYIAESPTYYKAFEPVLKTLQSLEVERIAFKEELVNVESGPIPDFLENKNACTFDAKIVHSNPQSERITLQEFFDAPYTEDSLFDEYQEEAVKQCLQNRIGIVQGPPGCGKTFIGVQMLRLLLSLSSLPSPKVLVLTYKNHALDEFLKGTLRYLFSTNGKILYLRKNLSLNYKTLYTFKI